MQPLFTAAALAGGEVLFVVAAHLRRETGNIIAPAGQNFAYDRIDALTHRNYSRIASIAFDCVASITRLCSNVWSVATAFSAALRSISVWLFRLVICARL